MGDEATERGALVDREGGQKRREGIMAQLLNRLRAEERIAGVEFWHSPERCGCLLKQGKIFWFKTEEVGPSSIPRGVVDISRCLSIKGAEDVINRAHAFELSTHSETMFFIAD